MRTLCIALGALMILMAPMTCAYAQRAYVEGAVGSNLGETQPDAARGSVGVTFDNLRGSVDVDRLQVAGGHAINVDATGALDLAPNGLLNPYVSGGYGHTFEGTNGADTKGDGFHYGAGIALQPACNLAVDLNVRRRERDTAIEPEDVAMVGVRIGGGRRCGSVDYSMQ